MTTTYVPQPGTMSARVIEHLKSLPAGTEIATGPLCDTLDLDSGSLIPCIASAIKHGAIVRRIVSPRVSMLSLGTAAASETLLGALGGPPPVNADFDDDPLVQRVVKAQQGSVSLPDVQRWPGLDALPPPAPPKAKRGPKPRPSAAPSPAPAPRRPR
jgi:hypothetical protein